jgi:hypothetical protein
LTTTDDEGRRQLADRQSNDGDKRRAEVEQEIERPANFLSGNQSS